MIKSKQIRNLTFYLHRYIGLVVGLVLVVTGLTGSLLVFEKEIDQVLIAQQFGVVLPQQSHVPIESVLDTVKTKYAKQPDFKVLGINTLGNPHVPLRVLLKSIDEKRTEVFVNPYTGAIMGSRQSEQTPIGLTFKLHYELLAGKVGQIIVGIVAILLFILSITGIVLWPGWRKLMAGFKIKWHAHPKRVNFDLHKVIGMIAAVFLTMIAFTGMCWNFWAYSKPLIHLATLTPIPVEPVSQPIEGKSPLALSYILKTADAALPGAVTTYISLPQTPSEVFRVNKKQPEETRAHGYSEVKIDQYTGKVVQLKNGLKPSRADLVLNSFAPLHSGTFWGLPTRILYVFVGLAPLVLFITGFVMWWLRSQGKNRRQQTVKTVERSTLHHS